jgi:hypothetical protein
MVFFQHLSDDAGALGILLVMKEALPKHRVEDSPMHGLESIAHIREGPSDNNAHGIIHIGFAHLVFDIHRNKSACGDRHDILRKVNIIIIISEEEGVIKGESAFATGDEIARGLRGTSLDKEGGETIRCPRGEGDGRL